jgi:hypothetical protein
MTQVSAPDAALYWSWWWTVRSTCFQVILPREVADNR